MLPLVFLMEQGVPRAPSALSAYAASPTMINLDWIDRSRIESGFRIYDGSIYVDDVPPNATSYRVYGVAPDSYHCYHIFAYNQNGMSSWTDWACTTTPISYDSDDSRFIDWGETLEGTIDEQWDEDIYFFHGLSWYGGRVKISVSATDERLDPYLIVYGRDGEVLELSDDDSCSTNSAVSFLAPWSDNGYRIVVRSSGFSSSGGYKLTIELIE